jgi:hypothetical protein
LLCVVGTVGCLLLVRPFRLFLVVCLATSAGASLLLSWQQIGHFASLARSAQISFIVLLGLACRSLQALILPALVCCFLLHRTTADAFAAAGEAPSLAPPRPRALLRLAGLGIVSGALGTFFKPLLLLQQWHTHAFIQLDLLLLCCALATLILWAMSIMLFIGGIGFLLRQSWGRRLIVVQALVSVILTSMLVALTLPAAWEALLRRDGGFLVPFAGAILGLMLDGLLLLYFDPRHPAISLIPAATPAPVPPARADADARSSAPPLPRS